MPDYVASVPYAHAIHNQLTHIERVLKEREKDLDKHVHIMFEYDVDDVVPSQYFGMIIDHHLRERGSPWRIHSFHLNTETLLGRTIIRRVGLDELVNPARTWPVHELQLARVMRSYSEQFDEPIITRAGTLFVFTDGNETPTFTWVFLRYFEAWKLEDKHPEKGWVPIESGDPLSG